ncbi:MAG TPA: ABC transporter ATP-binding protein [Thermoanaerobaculia bacterium]|nr:ABC transporter ATP-binding protein [Thermoanaerobaculia bacterium]
MSERHPSDRPLIIARDVTFGYGREKVLDGVSLEIRPRDFLAIIGPNGGGKTTLAKVLLGLLEPWSGEVVRNPPVRSGRMGYVPQFSTFDKDFPLRVSDVVLMGKLGSRSLFRPYSRADRADVEWVLERLGLTGLARVHVREISGGQLQRVLIARAIVSDPEILFLDEPTASIDAESREVLMTLLAELNRRIPVVVITHDITGLAPMVRRIACVNRRLVCHEGAELDPRALEEVYGGPVELVTHHHGPEGPAHRVLHHHH